jgi:hypothetical protein
VRVIGQAKGILMGQNHGGPLEAFDLLRRMSQRANIKVQVLAEPLIEQVTSSPKPLTGGNGRYPGDLGPFLWSPRTVDIETWAFSTARCGLFIMSLGTGPLHD